MHWHKKIISLLSFTLFSFVCALPVFARLPGCANDTNPCDSVSTGLGPISTNFSGAVSALFNILLSITGGVAVILIIFSGYNLMMSQGNPEKVKGAQETLTASIVGLLFIIFSGLILRIIGVDILGIPQFR